jgi:hypothetical protein
MAEKPTTGSVYGMLILIAVFMNAIVLKNALTIHENWYRMLFVTLPLLLLALLLSFRDKP